ncbi:DUF1800 domain-containing protein [Rubrivirga sp.]|uniref:DUF1800 domain-containing protein n=1 Tax=Rubrivirga sp. TaxID=1885344 RepID=UPI003B520F28
MRDRRSFLRLRRPAAPPTARAADLSPYVPSASDPWDETKVRHLLRRVSVGASPDDVRRILGETPEAAVDRIVDAAVRRPGLPEPDWIGLVHPKRGEDDTAFKEVQDRAYDELYHGTIRRLLGGGLADPTERLGESLRERMTVFWSNHYVAGKVMPPWVFRYRSLLRDRAFGDVRETVHAIGTTALMLRYLDGHLNRKGAPNENYARELLELFTMGIAGPDGTPNYTQADVSELARALTGWRVTATETPFVTFAPGRFDGGEKTVFGRTGAFGYDDVVPLLFEARGAQIAHFLAAKLYREFVSLDPDAGVIAGLAARLVASEFRIEPVVRALLKSAHFYDDTHVGALVKSPAEFVLGLPLPPDADPEAAHEQVVRYKNNMRKLGQDLLEPPDVKGWRDGEAWINTSTLLERVRYGQWEVNVHRRSLADAAADRPAAFEARALAGELCAELFARPPGDDDLDDLTEALLAGTPAEAWDPTESGGRQRVPAYVQHLVALPDYQLR